MKLVYDSLTGNTRRFTEQLALLTDLGMESLSQYSGGKYLLLTYTFGRGEIPKSTSDFLDKHANEMKAVVSSGSFHWGANHGRAGKLISERFSVPLLRIINKSGSQADLQSIKEWLFGQVD